MSESYDAAGSASPPVPTDSDEIERHVSQWSGLIARTATRFGISWADLDDLRQEVRIRVWRATKDSGEKRSALTSSYMYRIVRSAMVDYLRRRRDRDHLSLDRAVTVHASTDVTAEGLEAALGEALGRLAPERRIAVRLHLDGRHLSEIAELLDWSEGKARNLLYRGLEDLKHTLQDRAAREER